MQLSNGKLKKGIITATLVICVVILTFPFYFLISQNVSSAAASVVNKFQEETGIGFHYKKISPSLLTGIKMKSACFYDITSGQTILTVNSIRLDYDLLKIIKKDFDSAFEYCILKGVDIEYNKVSNAQFLEKIKIFIKKMSTQEGKKTNIPFGFKIFNTHIYYSDPDFIFNADIKNIKMDNAFNNEFYIANINGKLNFESKSKKYKITESVECDFYLTGNVTKELDSFESQLRIQSIYGKNFEIKPLSVLLKMQQRIMQANFLIDGVDSAFLFQYDMDNNSVYSSVKSNKLYFSKIISIKNNKKLATFLEKSSFSGNFEGEFFVLQKKLNYKLNSIINVEQNEEIGKCRSELTLFGNEKQLNIPVCNITSEILSANFDLICDLKTLQPSGSFFLNHYVLKNGNILSFEVYVDSMAKGFMCFVPQIIFGDQSFTALEINVQPDIEKKFVDYQLSFSDYSHQDSGNVGKISCDGSLIFEDKPYFQSSLNFDQVYLDSIFETLIFFADKSKKGVLLTSQAAVDDFIMSNECFVNSDFKSLTFNVPGLVIANTKKNGEMIFTSFSGNESTMQISQLEVLFAGQIFEMNFLADYDEGLKNMFFTTNMSLNSIPYSISGSIINGKKVNISGDYNFGLTFSGEKNIKAAVSMEMLPLNIMKQNFALSVNTDFVFNKMDDWNLSIRKIEFIDTNVNRSSPSHFLLSGSANNYGIVFENISFLDSTSLMKGRGSVLWSLIEGGFENVNILAEVSNDMNGEAIKLDGIVSNPSLKTFAQMDFISDVFVSAMVEVKKSPASRFFKNQKTPNLLNASLSVLGPINELGIFARIYDSSIVLQGENLVMDAQADFSHGLINFSDTRISWGDKKLNSINGKIDLSNFTGSIDGIFDGDFLTHKMNSPFNMQLEGMYNNIEKRSRHRKKAKDRVSEIFGINVPKDFAMNVIFKQLVSQKFKATTPVVMQLSSREGNIEVLGGRNFENPLITGLIKSVPNGKSIEFTVDKNAPLHFNLEGLYANEKFNFNIDDFYVDFSGLSYLINFDFFNAKEGIGNGAFQISGSISDLDIYGLAEVNDLLFTVPEYVAEECFVKNIKFIADDNELSVKNFAARTKKGYIDGSLSLILEGTALHEVMVKLKTRANSYVSAKFEMSNMSYECEVRADLDIDYIDKERLSLLGNIAAKNLTATFSLGQFEKDDGSNFLNYNIDLDMLAEQRCFVQFPNKTNPVLKALINPQTPIKLRMDTGSNYFEFVADCVLRGGSVVSLNRTFYLREGHLIFNESHNSFDPTITVRGEMRETDAEGNPVKIYLSAINQRMSNFNPMFSSNPAKSEREILSLLGQIVTNDDGKGNNIGAVEVGVNLLAGGLNYFAQSFIVTRIENSLRDFFKFDIFSLHPTILQNALILSMDPNKNKKEQTFGNYFDDSSVYIGKYFGDTFYLDVLFHFEYIEGLKNQTGLILGSLGSSGLKFEPEIGFELDSPFALIRFNLAPDLMRYNQSWVSGASIGLSWKFAF
ncbi:MAG: translocation/assembly module TamB domain-containing protein [Treponemataceae bacterium]